MTSLLDNVKVDPLQLQFGWVATSRVGTNSGQEISFGSSHMAVAPSPWLCIWNVGRQSANTLRPAQNTQRQTTHVQLTNSALSAD